MSPDDTFFNIKRLHVVFAAAAVALLGVTVWMVAADHDREWKVYQRTYRDRVEPWMTEARIREERTGKFEAREKELAAALAEARAGVPDRALVERFRQEVGQDAARRGQKPPDFAAVEVACESLAAEPDAARRDALVGQLRQFVDDAAVRQGTLERRLRFRRADFDETRSAYEIAVGRGEPQAELEALESRVDRIRKEVDDLSAQLDQATAGREALQTTLDEMTRGEEDARKALAAHQAEVDRLRRALARQSPSLAKEFLEWPMIDALGQPLAIDQVWLPELTIDYSFRQVARFDRCVTCHQGIAKSVPGSDVTAACRPRAEMTVTLPRPAGSSHAGGGVKGENTTPAKPTLESVYGLDLAPRGVLADDAPTVGLVLPKTPAAEARLLVGDVILKIDGEAVGSADEVRERLLRSVVARPQAANAFTLTIARGLPQPYCSHPRLDLFVGSQSPHPVERFGCTICHDGQGSATSFAWASHTPDDPDQAAQWRREHDWFRNPDWGFPMLPARFSESRCLKCHHAVTDLNPSRRFPDPPAPKLLAGYHLVRQYGCFGCHEIKGVGEDGRSVGPDMRLEPLYAAAALELAADPALSDRQRNLAKQVAARPFDAALRGQLVTSFQPAVKSDAGPTGKASPGGLRPASAALVEALAPKATPGTMRKVGPTLRDEAAKVDAAYLADRIANPQHFLPSTRMPRFYGLHAALDGEALSQAQRLEPVEIRAVAEYLLTASQPVEPAAAPPGVTEAPSPQRGKRLFQLRGCLACHKHRDFPEGQATQGPDLSDVGAKYTKSGARWLASWLRDPARHSPRTVMPNAMLEPEPLPAESGEEKGRGGDAGKRRMTDPAADIAAYLLGGPSFTPEPPPAYTPEALDELALLYLQKTFSRRLAEQYLREGIPASAAARAQGDAAELVGPITAEKKLRYVARRTIARRGCFGCHDIPGFELAQQIGPALSEWGRKQESLLAFEQVHRLLEVQGAGQGGADDPESSRHTPSAVRQPATADGPVRATASGGGDLRRADGTRRVPATFYLNAVRGQRREGFIWQKLRAPRSFDYQKARNKPYTEWLTMGRFNFTPQERERIITFVLGLVADPPAAKYVYQPGRRRRAIVEGQKVLDRYACARCHTLEMERWRFEYDPDEFEPPPPATDDFTFLKPHFSPQQVAASLATDRRGLASAEVVGMPVRGPDGEIYVGEGDKEDDEGEPLATRSFQLWEPAVIAGQICSVGGADVLLYEGQITGKRPPDGGAFARMLYPAALADARASGATVAGMEPWGWLPPALVGEGKKVRPAWLYDYLLNPTAIRPASLLRMPRYSLSPDEAAALVDYFAAASGVEPTYAPDPRGRLAQQAARERRHPARSDEAMRVLIDRKTFCAKCHQVGDYSPGQEVRTTLGPNLANAGARLRPDYVRRWLAHPRSVLPYTGMPVNFPPTGELKGQDLLPGKSLDQVDAVTELLLDYQAYMSGRTSIRRLIEAAGQQEK